MGTNARSLLPIRRVSDSGRLKGPESLTDFRSQAAHSLALWRSPYSDVDSTGVGCYIRQDLDYPARRERLSAQVPTVQFDDPPFPI